MYSVFQSVSWKICISPFDFTHQLQEVHCSNENRSTTFMLSSKCLSLSWFKCLIPVFQISTVITYRYIILMHNRFQDNQIWVLKTHRPFSVYTYMHTPCLMTSDCQTGLWSYKKRVKNMLHLHWKKPEHNLRMGSSGSTEPEPSSNYIEPPTNSLAHFTTQITKNSHRNTLVMPKNALATTQNSFSTPY